MEHNQEQNLEEQPAVVQQAPVDIQAMKEAIAHFEAATPEVAPAHAAATEQHQNGVEHQAAPVAETEAAPSTSVEQQHEEQPASQANGSAVMTPLIKAQLKHCATILRGMKRHSQAGPFLVPVDPIALGIPDYPTVITHPMDLSTIQKKLDGSEYESPQQFHDDVKLMLNNCYTYNKPETQVYGMAKNLEKYFDGHWAKLPTDLTASSSNNDFAARRRKSDVPAVARPRRESAVPQRSSSIIPAPPSARSKRSSPELTFCMNTWKDLTKKSHLSIAWPFLEPVDPEKLGIPDYLTIVKNPMDLSTMKKKLDAGSYANADEFEADFRLMVNNCYLYNGVSSEIAALGKQLEEVFDRKWATKPLPGATSTTYADYDVDAEKILALNKQIQALQKELDELLTKRQNRPVGAKPASSAAAPKPKSRAAPATMSFEEKRQLSLDVNNLSPEMLGKVVEIIHQSMPTLQQQSDSDVIELDIEVLDINTLRQLQKYVNECKGMTKKRKAPAGGAPRPKKSTPSSAVPVAVEAAAPSLEEALSSDESSSSDDDMA